MPLNLFEHPHSYQCTVNVLVLHGVTLFKKHSDMQFLKWFDAVALEDCVNVEFTVLSWYKSLTKMADTTHF